MTEPYKPDGKIFASNAKSGELASFPDISRGWGLTLEQTGGKPPMEWMNDLFQRADLALQFLQMTGTVSRFNADYCAFIGGYPKGAVLHSDDAQTLFVSAVDNNTENFNTSDPVQNWIQVGAGAEYATQHTPGPVQFATTEEVEAGIVTDKVTSPADLAGEIARQVPALASGAGKPSERHILLAYSSLPVVPEHTSARMYFAPADGYVSALLTPTAANQRLSIAVVTQDLSHALVESRQVSTGTTHIGAFVPVKKGGRVHIICGLETGPQSMYFTYAEGAPSS